MPHRAISACLQRKPGSPKFLSLHIYRCSAQLRRIVRKDFCWVMYLSVEKTMEKWTWSWTTDHEAVCYQKDTVRFLIYEQEGQQPPFPFLRIFTSLYPLRGAGAKVGEKPSSTWPSQVASGRFTRPCLTFLIRRVGTVLAFTSCGHGK